MLSIALPVRNGENYLSEALESILSQNDSNFELIVSDNNSIDKTQEILGYYQSKFENIKIYRSPSTLSQVENVNMAASLCTGEWIQFFCHDDIMLQGCVKFVNQLINEVAGSKIALIGHMPAWLFSNNYIHNPYFKIEDAVIYSRDVFERSFVSSEYNNDEVIKHPSPITIKRLISENLPLYLPALTTAIVKNDYFTRTGGFDNRFLHFDVFKWIQLLRDSDYVIIQKALTLTRIHTEQVAVHARKSLRTLEDMNTFWSEFDVRSLQFDSKRLLRTRFYFILKPISTAAGFVSIYLIKREFKNAYRILTHIPISWLPAVFGLFLRNYVRESRRIRALIKHVPVNQIYP